MELPGADPQQTQRIEIDMRRLILGRVEPGEYSSKPGSTLYRNTPHETFPDLVDYVHRRMRERFPDLVWVDSLAWDTISSMLSATLDTEVASAPSTQNLVAAKHLLALGGPYTESFVVPGGNHTLGRIRQIRQKAPREKAVSAPGPGDLQSEFKKSKTLRLAFAAAIISDSIDPSTLSWGDRRSKAIAESVLTGLSHRIDRLTKPPSPQRTPQKNYLRRLVILEVSLSLVAIAVGAGLLLAPMSDAGRHDIDPPESSLIRSGEESPATYYVQGVQNGPGILARVEPDMDADPVGAILPNGTAVEIECEAYGTNESAGSYWSNVWERLPEGSWLPNVYVTTGYDGRSPDLPLCSDLR